MCGIAGIINYKNYDLDIIKNSLFHRGPDDQSIYAENNVALIHTRLAIQDVKQGQQPFHYEHYSIVFNGEIYNHHELRQQLTEFQFRTNSDTETLLYLYIKFGSEMFSLLDGMFAFCVYDKKNNTLLIARDRAGKKPLYYTKVNDSFLFASELNSLKLMTNMEINEDAIQCYLRAGFIYKSYTPYKNVYKLEAGTFLVINTHTLRIDKQKYYDILHPYLNKNNHSFPEAIIQTDDLIRKSISDRLLASDVEVGAFLSGGIDSNLVVAVASEFTPKLKTFTVRFDGVYDESHLAKLTAEKYNTEHTEIDISINLDQDIEKILLQYGEPFADSSAIPSFCVAREAKKHVNVVLNGDGADELFGGYRRYVPVANQLLSYISYLSPIRSWLPKPSQKQGSYNYLYRLISMGGKKGLDYYLSATSDIYEDVLRFDDSSILAEMNAFVKNSLTTVGLTPLSKMLYLDFNLLLFSDLLIKMDIATMANSLEARSPFLSKYLLNFVPGLPDNCKIKGVVTKHILRELAKKYLPRELLNQPKRGFEVPLKKWVNHDLKDKIHDSLASGCYSENYVKRNFIQKLLKNNNDIPGEKRAKILWSLFCLEIWHKNEVNYLR